MSPRSFTKVVAADALGPEASVFDLEADETQRARLAERFSIPALESVNARLEAYREDSGDVVVSGSLEATAQQVCVVTLEPFPTSVEAAFRRRYTASPIDPELPEQPDEDTEPLTPELDLGELVAQEFGLALDPYPRAPGATLDSRYREDGESPFAVLRQLKR